MLQYNTLRLRFNFSPLIPELPVATTQLRPPPNISKENKTVFRPINLGLKGKGHPITGHEGPRGGVEV
jgi:hypothetical protein